MSNASNMLEISPKQIQESIDHFEVQIRKLKALLIVPGDLIMAWDESEQESVIAKYVGYNPSSYYSHICRLLNEKGEPYSTSNYKNIRSMNDQEKDELVKMSGGIININN